MSRCPGVTNCVLKYCLPVSRCPGVLFVGPLVHANQTSRFRRLLRGSAEGLVWLGGGSDSHGSWVPGPGLEWLGMILLWIHSFIHSCIHSFIYAFVHSYSQPSGTRTGTPEVSSRETSRETSRDTSRGTGATGGHQPGPETPLGHRTAFHQLCIILVIGNGVPNLPAEEGGWGTTSNIHNLV